MNPIPGKLYHWNYFFAADSKYDHVTLEIYEMSPIKEVDGDICETAIEDRKTKQRYKPVWIYDFWLHHKPLDVILLYTGNTKAKSNILYHQFLFGEKALWIKHVDIKKLSQVYY